MVIVLVLSLKVQSVSKTGCLRTLIVHVDAPVVIDLDAGKVWKGEHALIGS
jgi:hypothetical protein